ncbi:50S ribosomal protein L21e [Candidatus Pacearchaeota archaeon CG10_big_fil_rev_8_21_14_0_10_34_12]|nr:MAG: 50S ribosomal protein L21e [Candidatus Pacearchaeota archaeon CG10_big_fil_rev_8_21_14_0_10_34_12]
MKKQIREKGKIQLSRYFQKFDEGESVSVVREKSISVNFPKRLQGRTGVIEGRRGKAYMIKIKEKTKDKKFLIEPIHLKKMKKTS